MEANNSVAVFESKTIRRLWHKEEWFFSVVDVVGALTDSEDPRKYWNKLSQRLRDEGNESVTICHQLKLMSTDGKFYETDCANIEGLFRIIQSIPSKKAEPFKLWLAKTGYERIQEIVDPELSINRARSTWLQQGHSQRWIQQRMMGQEIRNKLTDYWREHEIKESLEFAVLTNIIHKEWSELSVKEHKALKGLENQNLRDHMSDAELIFTALAELATRKIAETVNATGLPENKIVSKEGGGIAKRTREDLEKKTNKKIVSEKNYLPEKKKQLNS